jgi:magnesium-transporting ATPase (P-type)
LFLDKSNQCVDDSNAENDKGIYPVAHDCSNHRGSHFKDVLIYILLAAAVITAIMGHWVDTFVILGVAVSVAFLDKSNQCVDDSNAENDKGIYPVAHDCSNHRVILGVAVINALIGFIQESNAEKSLKSIQNMLANDHNLTRRHGDLFTVSHQHGFIRQHILDAFQRFLGVAVINALIGFIQESNAEKSLKSIQNMLANEAMLVRELFTSNNRKSAGILSPGRSITTSPITISRVGTVTPAG